MSETKNQESGLAEYNAGVIQLGDTELNGVPDQEIAEKYNSENVDAIVYHGDASKKQDEGEGVSHDTYLDQLQETYESLNNLGSELDADVLTLPGNHEPISGNHYNDEEYVEEVKEMIDEEYDEFSEFDGNAFEFFVDSKTEDVENDNLVNFSGSVYETDSGISLVGLGSHMEPEIDRETYELLNADPDTEDLGYEEDDLERVAEELSTDKEFNYGLLSRIPVLGNWIEKAGDYILEAINYGKDVDLDEVDLEDIEELGDEFMSKEHQEYLDKIEEIEGSEEYAKFEEKIEKIEQLIESAEGEVAVFNHSTPHSENNEYGSTALTHIADEYGDQIEMIGGGHSHNPAVHELGETKVVNAAETYTEIGFGDELYTEQHSIEDNSGTRESGEQEQPTLPEIVQEKGPEAAHQMINQNIDRFESALEDDVDEEAKEDIRQRIGHLEEMHEVVDQIAEQESAGQANDESEATA